MSFRDLGTQKLKHSIGKLSHRISIQEQTQSFKKSGVENTFVEKYKVWAGIETFSGLRKFNDINIEEVPTHKITIRTIPTLNSDLFISYRGERYRILTVQKVNEGILMYQILHCRLLGNESRQASES